MCAGVGANIQDLICAIGSDKRIGDAFFINRGLVLGDLVCQKIRYRY